MHTIRFEPNLLQVQKTVDRVKDCSLSLIKNGHCRVKCSQFIIHLHRPILIGGLNKKKTSLQYYSISSYCTDVRDPEEGQGVRTSTEKITKI